MGEHFVIGETVVFMALRGTKRFFEDIDAFSVGVDENGSCAPLDRLLEIR
ncbi:hypothetical protein [Natronococcus jeotgali]|nr:hypothetical protein [Natronococcus jeotgali]